MAEYRRVTKQCAKDDWSKASTHSEVLAAHGNENILQQFFAQQSDTWYSQDALRERRRGLAKGQASPGTRPIGSLKVSGFRAWVWHDDGSVYEVDTDFPEYDLHWIIAYGNRRKDDRSDLQSKRQDLLHDPDDSWRPVDADYAELLAEHDDAFTAQSADAIRAAVERAEGEHNTVIEIGPSEIQGSVVHEYDADIVQGVVVEEINERWVLLDKFRRGGRVLTFADAELLSVAGFPKEVDPVLVSQEHIIRGGLLYADPETHYIFYAELPN